ncbi:MAG: DUF1659 domain-containing protein [Fervidobacterium sp.]|nr:DUF1659 domain-containing protein [Fervidobacterium sp.]
MKRLSIRWIIGEDEQGKPIYRRQTLTVSEDFSATAAQTVVNILDKYSKYLCESAQIISTESVGDSE